MRTLKFRAWNSQTGKMIDLQAITPLAMDAKLLELGAKGLFIPFDEHMILMQFTGLTDKNSKDIFCSDILRIESSSTGTVIEGRGGYIIEFADGRRLSFEDVASEHIEVVGNTWEQAVLTDTKGQEV